MKSLVIGCIAAVAMVQSHTIMTKPTPRENTVHTNNGNFQCGTSATITGFYQRGQVIDVQYGRNNHWGGFSIFSVLPVSRAGGALVNNADVIAAFQDPANIFHTSCYNSGAGCHACNGCADKFGLGGDGTAFQQTLCGHTLTVPTWLADGDYVMKWTVSGNGDSFGVRNLAHGTYSNCHNFRVAGGSALLTKPAANQHIEFQMTDEAIKTMANNGINLAQGQCMFSGGAVAPTSCKFVDGQKGASCFGPVSDLVRCGGATADTRAQCLTNGGDPNTAQGSDLFNYLVGLPSYHPNYNGGFTMLSHTATATRAVSVAGGGGAAAGGGAGAAAGGGTGAGGTCALGTVNCRPTPGCCGAGSVCYEKDNTWASCLPVGSCAPGIHLTDPAQFQTPWTCQVLTPAAANQPFGIFWKNNADRVVDNAGAANVNGNSVWMWNNLGPGIAQRWVRTDCGQIKWVNSDKCLDVFAGNNVNGNLINVYFCDCANNNQKFDPISAEGLIRWTGSNKCLDVTNGNMNLGTRLQIWDCTPGNVNQQFEQRAFLGNLARAAADPYIALTKDAIKPAQFNINWSSEANGTTLFVPVGSTINFNGADKATNPVSRVCGTAYSTTGFVNADMECETSDIQTLDGSTFIPDKEGITYLVGNDFANKQKVTVIASNSISFSDPVALAAVNQGLATGTTPSPAPSNTLPFIIAGGVVGAIIVAVVVVLIIRRSRQQQAPTNKV